RGALYSRDRAGDASSSSLAGPVRAHLCSRPNSPAAVSGGTFLRIRGHLKLTKAVAKPCGHLAGYLAALDCARVTGKRERTDCHRGSLLPERVIFASARVLRKAANRIPNSKSTTFVLPRRIIGFRRTPLCHEREFVAHP